MSKDLTPKQEKFITALMTTPNLQEACKVVGISPRTGQRYLANVTVKRAYREKRSQAMEQASSRLHNTSVRAVEVLEEIMEDASTSPYARQQAARTILEFGYKAYENETILERIDEIQAVIGFDDKGG